MDEQTINIRGVEWTEKELAQALQDLRELKFRPGDIVARTNHLDDIDNRFLIVSPSVREAHVARWPHIKDHLVMIGLHNGESDSFPARLLRRVCAGVDLW